MAEQAQEQAQQEQAQQGQAQSNGASGASTWNPFAALEQVGLLALGAADLALDQVRQATDRGQGAMRRSDLRELMEDGMKELRARGELASRRVTEADSKNYLELMARRAVERTEAIARAEGVGSPHA
ncbi:hypothetical protein AB0I10_16695 [Streptomyces sp. NPDC050636]|uniref:hypothetical protein n=1 Tax=Streptomyces sp. NPDC050636 TaxID=3154510 RepID=UPI00342297F8